MTGEVLHFLIGWGLVAGLIICVPWGLAYLLRMVWRSFKEWKKDE